MPEQTSIEGLNRQVVGHYNYYGVRGNSRDLWRFYQVAIARAFKRAYARREVFA